MGPTSATLLVVGGLAVIAAATLTALTWDVRRWRLLRRTTCLLVCQVLALGVAAVVVNRQLDLFTSWSDLVGASPVLTVSASRPGTVDASAQAAADRSGGGSVVVPVTITGGASHLTKAADVYLPADYFAPGYAAVRFPVLEVNDGFPGSPASWLDGLHLQAVLDQEIAAHRMSPLIAVLPTQNTSPFHDSECVNAVGGAQMATFLTNDVQTAIERNFRAETARTGWALMGYSTGGFCAVNLALHAPTRYAAAVSLSGYFSALTDLTTGDLYHGNRADQLANSPSWEVSHLRLPGLAFFLAASGGDAGATHAVHRFAAALHWPLEATTAVLPRGGHTFAVWRALEPAALDWVSSHLSPPLAPSLQYPAAPPTRAPAIAAARRP